MNEIPMIFGAERHLVGTLALPATPASQPMGILLFNAGVVHRIGPHRINVKLARHLASLGFPSLRFDLSGQGDSRASSSAASYREQAVIDLRAAMDHMERTAGVRRFAIVGICSGANHGLACALADDRVAGLWMLDGHAYPTRRTRWLLYRRKFEQRGLLSSAAWAVQRLAALPGQLVRRFGRGAGEKVDDGRVTPPAAEFAQALQTIVDRGVAVSMMYSGSLLNTYNYPEQFMDVFGTYPFARRIRCEFAPDIDHTVTPVSAQRKLLALVADWARDLSRATTPIPERSAA